LEGLEKRELEIGAAIFSVADLKRVSRVLCIGAHSDDIEIGCGGTILRLVAECADLHVRWEVFSGSGQREIEAKQSAAAFSKGVASMQINVHRFRDAFFPSEAAAIKEKFEELKGFEPQLILTHRREDAHQDHRLLADLTWNTFRRHAILEYEIPKYDGDLGQPNFFVSLDQATCDRKVELLMTHFPSQRDKQWFDAESFRAILRIRGVESAAPAGWAEGFCARKVCW
jgi:LmbE family N-acetylglucosaminyl deacetylase